LIRNDENETQEARWIVTLRGLFGLLVMTVAVSLLMACGGTSSVKIGMLSPQTGPIAQFAPGFATAGSVGLAAINEVYDGDFEFELITADSGCDSTTAATAAQTLIDSGVLVIVGAACSGASTAAIAVASPAGVPMISYASTAPALTTVDDNGYFFRVVPSDAQQAVALTDVASAAGASNPAVLYMTNDYGAGLGDNFISNWSGAICTKAAYDPAEGKYDASALAQAVVSGGCDSVLLMSYSTDGASIVEALTAQGFEGVMIGADGIADANFTGDFTDASAVDGLIATRPRPGKGSVAKSKFESAYAAADGKDGIYTHETYDAIKIAAAAIASDPDGDLRVAVAKIGTNYDGASGNHTFDANGDVIGTGYEVCQFTGTNFSCPRIWSADGGLATK
jgi:branched-chain amino acid transport system substrate-binding protein